MRTMLSTELEFTPDTLPAEAPETPAEATKGRPAKYASDAERKAAKRERDRRYRERKKAGNTAKRAKANEGQRTLEQEIDELSAAYEDAGASQTPTAEERQQDDAPKGAEPAPAPAPTVTPLVTGFVLLAMTDALMPTVVGFLLKKRGRILKNPDALVMSDGEREALGPIADEAAKHILARMHPVALYGVAVLALGYMKGNALSVEDPERKARRKRVKPSAAG